jgi:glycerophosphoryl diester phosphodiesterase
MLIVGHRGAAGLAPENTIMAIKKAVSENVDMIEFDIQSTKDNHLVLIHDSNLLRIAGDRRNVSDLTLKQIQQIKTHSGERVPSLKEALKAVQGTPLFLDCKGKNWAILLHKSLKKHADHQIAVTSRNLKEMSEFQKLAPQYETYVCEYVNVFNAIYQANYWRFTGISFSFWLANPLAYLYARHRKLKIMLFTVNRPSLARLLHKLYPNAGIITNVPDKLIATRIQTKKG